MSQSELFPTGTVQQKNQMHTVYYENWNYVTKIQL